MKKRTLLYPGLALLAVAAVLYFRAVSGFTPVPAAPAAGPGEKLAISTSPGEIFRRAFWRHPASEDVIVNAERREWTHAEEASVLRWQWFLALHPSPALLRALRDPETFELHPVPAKSVTGISTRPLWFPSSGDGFEILQSPSATFKIFYRTEDNTLFATDMGHGFAPAQNRGIASATP